MNILVFGKDGQLGKAFQTFLGSLAAKSTDALHVQYVGRSECDLSDTAALAALLNQSLPNLIINTSAYTAVDKQASRGAQDALEYRFAALLENSPSLLDYLRGLPESPPPRFDAPNLPATHRERITPLPLCPVATGLIG